MREMNKDEVKCVQLDILKRISEFCDKNGIRYFLGYGTLIGAVRHKGFIPWDDDIDIVMLREEYERFIEITSDPIDDIIDVYEYRRNKNYVYPFAKAINNKTLMVENEMNPNYKIGVYIDIFPIDRFPNGKGFDIYIKKMNLLKNFIGFSANRFIKKNVIIKDIIRYLVFMAFKLFNPHFFLKLMKKSIDKYSKSKGQFVGNCVWGYGRKERVNETVFSDIQLLEFEGNLYNVPIGWHDWLTTVYGDYMKLPPENQRIAKHNYSAFWVD